MAMSAAGGKGKKRPMGEINVTPMVDVMLVLLVIFMITAPAIKQMEAVKVNLPQLTGDAVQTVVTEDARSLTIGPDGSVAREGAKSADDHYDSMGELIDDLKQYKTDCDRGKKTPVVVIAGDRTAKWERIMQVWNAVKTAGISEVSFEVTNGTGAPATTQPAAQ